VFALILLRWWLRFAAGERGLYHDKNIGALKEGTAKHKKNMETKLNFGQLRCGDIIQRFCNKGEFETKSWQSRNQKR